MLNSCEDIFVKRMHDSYSYNTRRPLPAPVVALPLLRVLLLESPHGLCLAAQRVCFPGSRWKRCELRTARARPLNLHRGTRTLRSHCQRSLAP